MARWITLSYGAVGQRRWLSQLFGLPGYIWDREKSVDERVQQNCCKYAMLLWKIRARNCNRKSGMTTRGCQRECNAFVQDGKTTESSINLATTTGPLKRSIE